MTQLSEKQTKLLCSVIVAQGEEWFEDSTAMKADLAKVAQKNRDSRGGGLDLNQESPTASS